MLATDMESVFEAYVSLLAACELGEFDALREKMEFQSREILAHTWAARALALIERARTTELSDAFALAQVINRSPALLDTLVEAVFHPKS